MVALTGLEITFVGVHEDSRCPADMECDWQNGQVVIRLTMDAGNSGGVLMLGTPGYGTKYSGGLDILGYRISLLGIKPSPADIGVIIPEANYVALLQVVKD